jgi:hypothetical protein
MSGLSLPAARKQLRAASFLAPSIGNGSARFGVTLLRNRETREYEAHIFDRSPCWITPRMGYSVAGPLAVVTCAARIHLECAAQKLAPHGEAIRTAIMRCQPLKLSV